MSPPYYVHIWEFEWSVYIFRGPWPNSVGGVCCVYFRWLLVMVHVYILYDHKKRSIFMGGIFDNIIAAMFIHMCTYINGVLFQKKGIQFLWCCHLWSICKTLDTMAEINMSTSINPTCQVKFMLSKKATKIDEVFTVDLTLCSTCQIDGEDFVNFCGLLRKHEL